MVLRVLWLKENNAATWEKVNKLQDNLKYLKSDGKASLSIVQHIHNHCNLSEFSKDEIQHIIGT